METDSPVGRLPMPSQFQDAEAENLGDHEAGDTSAPESEPASPMVRVETADV